MADFQRDNGLILAQVVPESVRY